MLQMGSFDKQSSPVQAVAPGMQLSRGLGAQGLEPQGSWGSWLVDDWGPHEKLQGAGGRPQHWGPHMEELRQKQLPGG